MNNSSNSPASWQPGSVVRALALSPLFLLPVVPSLRVDLTPLASILFGLLVALLLSSMASVLLSRDIIRLKWLLGSPLFIFANAFLLSELASMFFTPRSHFCLFFPQFFCFAYVPILIFPLMLRRLDELFPGFFLMWLASVSFAVYNIILCLPDPSHITPLDSMGVHKNYVGDISATAALLALSFIMTLQNRTKYWWLVAIAGVSIPIGATSCFFSNARACLLSLPVSGISIALCQMKRKGNKPFFFALGLAVALLVAGLKLAPEEKLDDISTTGNASAAVRADAWATSSDYLSRKPLSPVGFHCPAIMDDSKEVVVHCNFFTQIWIELGLWAAVAYTAMTFTGLLIAYRACARGTNENWKQVSFVGAACLSLQILKFIREVQDSVAIGFTWGMALPDMLGICLFLYLLIKKKDIGGNTSNSSATLR